MWKIGCHKCLVWSFITDGISSEVESAQVLKRSEVYHLQDQIWGFTALDLLTYWNEMIKFTIFKPHLITLHYQAEQWHCFQWRGCSGFEEHPGFQLQKCGCWTNLNLEVSQECPDLQSPLFYWMTDLSKRRTVFCLEIPQHWSILFRIA